MTGFRLKHVKNSVLWPYMSRHYSKPKGFVGRNLCFLILYEEESWGAIVAGSATKHLPGRHDFLGTSKDELNNIINNTFFRLERQRKKYPMRNFTTKILQEWRARSVEIWERVYGDPVRGFETLVQIPLTGELYKRDGWTAVGKTKGLTCKRVSGKSSDSWGGKRVWGKGVPKLVFCRGV